MTGPEATALMNREHVRLMKLMDDTNHLQKQHTITCGPTGVQVHVCTLLVRHIHTETTKLVKTTFVHSFVHRVSELSD